LTKDLFELRASLAEAADTTQGVYWKAKRYRRLVRTSKLIQLSFFLSQTRAPNNVAFRVAGTRDAKSNAIAGDLEGKYVDAKNGVTLTQTWTTSNVLKTQIELENQVAKG
jgi:hypothetical protein